MVAQGVARSRVQAGDRRQRHGLGEDIRRQLRTQGFEQRQLVGRGQVFGLEVTAHKVAAHPGVGVVEQLAVHPLVVHGQHDGLAHPHVLELGQAGVEHKALKVPRVAVLQLALDQAAAVKLLAGVGTRPFAGDEGLDVIELASLEGLELRGGVFVEPVDDAIKVVRAFAHVEVFAPVSWVAHVLHVFAKVDLANAVGPRAYGQVGHDLVQRLARAPAAREHRQAAHDQRQLGVGPHKVKADAAITQHRDRFDLAEIGSELRRGFFADQLVIRVFDVGGQHRLAVVKTRQGVEREGDRKFVRGQRNVLREQAVGGGRFFGVTGQQGLENQAGQAGRRRAFEGEGVVFVITGSACGRDHRNLPTLGRVGVDVSKVAKACGIADVAKLRIRVRPPGRHA